MAAETSAGMSMPQTSRTTQTRMTVIATAVPRPAPGRGELVVVSDLLGDSISRSRLQAAGELGWRPTLVQVLDPSELVPAPGTMLVRDERIYFENSV